MTALPDLMRRIDRKLDIQRGLALSYDDLALLVATGAYEALQVASRRFVESQCRAHIARSQSISGDPSPSTKGGPAETLKSSGTTANENANEALARARAASKKVKSR